MSIDSDQDEESLTHVGSAAPSSPSDEQEVEVADGIAEFVEGVLDEGEPKTWEELQALAEEGLKNARKRKSYRDEVVFASLVQLYRFAPRQGRLRGSLRVARNLGRGPAFARVLNAHARHFEAMGSLKPGQQGKRPSGSSGSGESALDDEAFSLGVKSFLRTLAPGTVTPTLLQHHVNEHLFPSLKLRKTSISKRQARRWLYRLGYRLKSHQKGVYWDGHERKDVRKHRQEFCDLLKSLEPYMAMYEGPEMKEVPPNLAEGEVEHVFIYQDESTFHDNDFQGQGYYLKHGEQVLKKKTRGRLMHRSGYICARYGNLALPPEMVEANARLPEGERLTKTDSGVTIFPSNKDGGDTYWNTQQMITQLRHAILIARRLFPNAVIHWVFDNSSCHDSRAPGALNAREMNVGPGGRVRHMHDTIIPLGNPHGHGGELQSMQFPAHIPDNHPYKKFEGKPKGMRIILEECGYIKPGTKLVGDCKLCKAKRARKPKLALSPEEMDLADCEDLVNDSEDESRPSDCCLLRILELQEDFQNELCLLQKVVEEAGNQCHFLPKFHPELNPIEYYWGWCKNYFRERSNGNFERGKRLLQEAVDMCPLITIRRFFRRASRYLSIYHLGATGVVAEFAAKRYRGHRGVMQKDIDQAQAEWEVKQTKLTVGQSLH
ncbi:hypothetical protein CONPUDRAFT_68340 [Coniophora puteana RWD-64-598 SS2]|uniref:Tc1-like transposase DDE domain-containing protein n=1 Tax=Coniophora puteana (strain RWD-64-598) TaxID=741705 RepID=R7SFH1_CONPW|nr:uncharacterized protein CONPUDRAFT_68340 [Coniophora puteana RWD-64-598 SS2]EIW73824.1 hypothetical protein CONPUDRAFT_68340 [Coniophora puteana RWD-64-598 SS2]